MGRGEWAEGNGPRGMGKSGKLGDEPLASVWIESLGRWMGMVLEDESKVSARMPVGEAVMMCVSGLRGPPPLYKSNPP